MRICIYCGQLGENWPVEHVLPQMFGRFEPANLVLNDVCGDCNNTFSKLEQALGRDTPEALQRLVHGLKPYSAAEQLGNLRVTYFVDRKGPWYGARVVLAGDHELYPVLLPQAAFQLSEDRAWDWILEEQISEEVVRPYLGKQHRVKVLGDSAAEIDRVQKKLESFEVHFEDPHPLEIPPDDDGKLELGLQAVIDDTVLRALAKIGFNYLAYVAGTAFVLHESFDEIRSYILRGAMPDKWRPVAIAKHRFLLGDTSQPAEKSMHTLDLGWSRDQSTPVADITFFGGNTYRITMCWNYRGVWRLLRVSHRFDPRERRISVFRPV